MFFPLTKYPSSYPQDASVPIGGVESSKIRFYSSPLLLFGGPALTLSGVFSEFYPLNFSLSG